MAQKLNKAEREQAVNDLAQSGWSVVDGRDAIQKQFKFKSFVRAFGWMSSVAIVAEKMNHHPEWSNVYSTVNVVLTTHDADGLSELDIKLARKMDTLAQ
ncbi:putative pterin-4-alpha-carbinolamine dehydratase [Amylibacter ulvae]|uniref:Putative pterin-4-alpha-carbinolamine dehydratase n=1 Tax=Paramylibacter ulvae TaxID=1651968 RepID=A0ABQ3D7G5_9RHOB|nr:4a-hydroxytetrahydrobiopterin dehydratase [Amylibacter ulvae]GHA59408.1 putative pterin-4-alpha-carbinolamine dehydratase [Amylibacter ulvae]